MRDAGLERPEDVHFVQIKCPLLTADRVAETEARGLTTATRDTLKSMSLSRAASALGVGVALGELDRERLTDANIGRDFSLCSPSAPRLRPASNWRITRSSSSAPRRGLGRPSADRPRRHGRRARRRAGARDACAAWFVGAGQLAPQQAARVVALLAKAEAGASGLLRGRRHTMLNDSDISSTRHARAFVAGALGALIGHAEIFVSGGAEHQGPDGGGPVAIIARGRTMTDVLPLAKTASPPGRGPSLETMGMSKAFGRFKALDDVSINVPAGTFHALLGENGAGKSTLVKCVMGFYSPDKGNLLLDGQEVKLANPRDAQMHGVGMVYQHFTLVPSLTAEENLVVSRADAPGVINWRKERGRLEAFLSRMPFRVPLDRPVASLAAGEKQKLEILKLLYLDQRFLILDEPTSVLTPGRGRRDPRLAQGHGASRRDHCADDHSQVPRSGGFLRRRECVAARTQGRRR